MSYAGNVADIPLGNDGLTGSRNLALVPPGKLLKANNVSYHTGAISREGGSTKYNAVAMGSTVIGGWDWWPTAALQRQIVFNTAGAILRDAGTATFPTVMRSGLVATNVIPIFVEGAKEAAAAFRKLFI